LKSDDVSIFLIATNHLSSLVEIQANGSRKPSKSERFIGKSLQRNLYRLKVGSAMVCFSPVILFEPPIAAKE